MSVVCVPRPLGARGRWCEQCDVMWGASLRLARRGTSLGPRGAACLRWARVDDAVRFEFG